MTPWDRPAACRCPAPPHPTHPCHRTTPPHSTLPCRTGPHAALLRLPRAHQPDPVQQLHAQTRVAAAAAGRRRLGGGSSSRIAGSRQAAISGRVAAAGASSPRQPTHAAVPAGAGRVLLPAAAAGAGGAADLRRASALAVYQRLPGRRHRRALAPATPPRGRAVPAGQQRRRQRHGSQQRRGSRQEGCGAWHTAWCCGRAAAAAAGRTRLPRLGTRAGWALPFKHRRRPLCGCGCGSRAAGGHGCCLTELRAACRGSSRRQLAAGSRRARRVSAAAGRCTAAGLPAAGCPSSGRAPAAFSVHGGKQGAALLLPRPGPRSGCSGARPAAGRRHCGGAGRATVRTGGHAAGGAARAAPQPVGCVEGGRGGSVGRLDRVGGTTLLDEASGAQSLCGASC